MHKIFDQDIFLALYNEIDDRSVILKLAYSFLDDVERRKNTVTNAIKELDYDTVELEVHTLASSAATYGATCLEKLCRQIEYHKDVGSPEYLLCIKKLDQLSESTVSSMKAFLDKL